MAANKTIHYVDIDAEGFKADLTAAGYSIRSLAKKLGNVSETSIRRWLKAGKIPFDRWQQMGPILYGDSFKYNKSLPPRYKTVWMRLGVRVMVTEDELYDMMTRNHDDLAQSYFQNRRTRIRDDLMDDYDMSEGEAAKFLSRAVADGESYIPDCCFDEHLEWWQTEKKRRKRSK